MLDKVKLAAMVRYHLGQLGAQNGHHEFEHICRHLAKARICSNILPATGPVSAGGDSGSDFETFTTFLSDENDPPNWFQGLADQRKIVFCCTIQKKSIAGKIKRDIKKTLERIQRPEHIVYFAECDIAIARRHEIQAEVKLECDITVDVWDGQAISENLVEQDTLWIAERFLSIPKDLLPEHPEDVGWYISLWEKYIRSSSVPQTRFEYTELIDAARFAAEDSRFVEDRPAWKQSISIFVDALEKGSEMWLEAAYELIFISAKGGVAILELDDVARTYFNKATVSTTIDTLEDVSGLIMAYSGLTKSGRSNLSIKEIESHSKQLNDNLDHELNVEKSPNRKSRLLEIRGYNEFSTAIRNEDAGTFHSSLKYWDKAIRTAKYAPFFPLDRFCDRMAQFMLFFAENSGINEIIEAADELLQQRIGGLL